MTLAARVTALAQAIAAKVKDLYTKVPPAGGTNGQVLIKTSNLDYAYGWGTPAATGATIDDATTSASKVWSSTKTNTAISAAVAATVGAAPAALDTLTELATALGNDANFATSTATALGNRVRVDVTQSLSSAQQAQGRANIAAYGSDEIGNPDTDFVTQFNTALA